MNPEKFKNLENIVKELHNLNFGKEGLIGFATDDSDYNFGCLKDGKHFDINDSHDFDVCLYSGCKKCESRLANAKEETENQELNFTSVTHGAHTFDFLDAHNQSRDSVAGWSPKPVLFVMENPAFPDAHYADTGHSRRISEWWYWINGQYDNSKYKNDDFIYPEFFVQKEYGWMIYSVIRTFKMANAYVTNMVKCGMTCDGKNYLTTDEYPSDNTKNYITIDITRNCINSFLKRELDSLRGENKNEKVIVFAFGERTYYSLKEALKGENISLHLLPHPANRLANDYRKYVLFGKILRALLLNNFYHEGEKPNFEEILSADIEKEPQESFDELCINGLENICKEKGYELKKRKSYDPNRDNKVVCYTFTVNADDETESLILRHATEVSVNETLYKVSWAEYRFDDKSIRLYAGKANSANVWIKEKDADKTKFPIYRIIKAFAEAYQTKYESPNGSNQG